MGFASNIGQKLRNVFANDKAKQAHELARGGVAPSLNTNNYDVLSVFSHEAISDYLRLDHDLLARIQDYESMDEYAEISSALDVYADDATQVDSEKNKTVWVESKDKTTQDNLNDLFAKRLRVEEESWEIARSLSKYGSNYEEILVTGEGVMGLNFLPAATMRRIEGPRNDLYGFIQDFRGKVGFTPNDYHELMQKRGGKGDEGMTTALEDWEVVHFRLRGQYRRSVYGQSVLEPARWIWKRLMLLEDAALIYRLQRAPERFAFYVDVGDMPPQEALAYVNRVRQQMKKQKYMNAQGKLDLRFNVISQDEDYFIPSRKGQDGTRVEVLGAPSWQQMDDITYFQDKLFAAMKVPKSYLGKDEGAVRAVLSQQDVRFARSVLRLQRELRNGFSKVARVHLAAQGINPYNADYEIRMCVPSSIFELAQLEVRNARADLAGRMKEFVSLHWLLRNVFAIPEEEIEDLIDERKDDMVRDGMLQNQIQAAGQQMMMQGQMGGDQGGGGGGGDEPAPYEGGEDSGDWAPSNQGQPSPQTQAKQIAFGRALMQEQRRRRDTYVPPITERELFAGSNRESEKRAEGKLEEVLRNDKNFAARLTEVQALLREMRGLSKFRR